MLFWNISSYFNVIWCYLLLYKGTRVTSWQTCDSHVLKDTDLDMFNIHHHVKNLITPHLPLIHSLLIASCAVVNKVELMTENNLRHQTCFYSIYKLERRSSQKELGQKLIRFIAQWDDYWTSCKFHSEHWNKMLKDFRPNSFWQMACLSFI